MSSYRIADLIYENPLAGPDDVVGWRLEGPGAISSPCGRMRMESLLDPREGQKANFVHWCSEDFPADVVVSWDFHPIREPGLCILFFAAKGGGGEDLFDACLADRSGPYDQYHHGDINAYHISYFRRRHPQERAFHTVNLRKSHGFHLVAQGPDPLPDVADAMPPYRVQLARLGGEVFFSIGDLPLLHFSDDGETFGPVLGGGKIGFRQMSPLIAEYANLTVHKTERT